MDTDFDNSSCDYSVDCIYLHLVSDDDFGEYCDGICADYWRLDFVRSVDDGRLGDPDVDG